MTGTIDVSQDVPGCVGGIRERPPVDIGGGIREGEREVVVVGTCGAGRHGVDRKCNGCGGARAQGCSFIICRSESQRLKSLNRHIPPRAAKKQRRFCTPFFHG